VTVRRFHASASIIAEMAPSDLDFRIWQHEADNVTAN